jgi:hypothetical protein
MTDDPLVRREIRARLKRDYGWRVDSHVNGTIDVEVPTRTTETAFLADVERAVREMGFEPTARIVPRDNSRWVRFTTPGTLAQKGKGGH